MLKLLIALATLASGIQALAIGGKQVDIGLCPNITEKQDFDPVPYLGRWFETQRFSAIFEFEQDCVNAIYSDMGDGYVEVYNIARTPNGGITNITGKAHVIAPGVLLVEFPGEIPGEYHVLDTDYDNYACVYSCAQEGPLRLQYAWLLSRTMVVEEDIYNHAIEVYQRNGIDISLFHPTYQGEDCPYPEI